MHSWNIDLLYCLLCDDVIGVVYCEIKYIYQLTKLRLAAAAAERR